MPQSQQQRRDRQAREQKPQEQEPQRLGWSRFPREQGLAQWDQQGQRQGLPPILQWSSGEGLVLVVGEERDETVDLVQRRPGAEREALPGKQRWMR